MPEILQAYGKVVAGLTPILRGLHRRLVVVDGRDGSGRTTLGRYLAWHFNCTLLETDLFLISNQATPTYRREELIRIIRERLAQNAPIIVEPVLALDLIESFGIPHDYWIHITNTEHEGAVSLMPLYAEYENRRRPVQNADAAITVSVL